MAGDRRLGHGLRCGTQQVWEGWRGTGCPRSGSSEGGEKAKHQGADDLELKSGGDLTGVLSYRSHVAASRQTISKFRNVSKFTSQFIKPEMTARSLVIKIRFLQDSHEFKRI